MASTGIVGALQNPTAIPVDTTKLQPDAVPNPTTAAAPQGNGTTPASSTLAAGTAAPTTTGNATTSVPAVAGYTATGNGSVSDQLQKQLDPNSPLMQQARTSALQQMNDRGLVNSSMALTAGNDAAYRAALPIAQSDASASNAADQFNANAVNTRSTQQLQTGANQDIANTEAQYKQLTQGSASAASIINNAQNAISQIVANNQLDAGAKQRAIDNINANVKNSMGLVGALAGDVNLGDYINQVTA